MVLREHEWAENMIQSKTLGKKPSETLRRVARYYIDNGYSKNETRELLDAFLIQCEPKASLPKWSDALDYALARALKYDAIEIDGIDITQPEMERIDSLEGKQLRRLAFTLLCLAKYWNTVMPNGDGWVNNKENEITALANITATIQRQCLMYHSLRECGMIQFAQRVDNTNVRVCFAEDGETVLRITDFRNLGYQYLKYHGEPYFECKNCGIITKYNNPSRTGGQKYCKDCAYEINIRNAIASTEKRRAALSSSGVLKVEQP